MLQRLPRSLFALLITTLYGAMLAVVMFHHELWRDEAQAWMITKASSTLSDLLYNMRYEGHPPLWNLIMWPFTAFDNPEWIKVPHFILAICTSFLVLRFAPFPRWLSVLLVFSYFFFFEYGVISRDYQLGLLGTIGFLSFLPRAPEKPWLSVFFLAVAITSNVFALILALPLSLLLLLRIGKHASLPTTNLKYKWQIAFAVVLMLALLASTAYSLKPPADEGFASTWYWTPDNHRMEVILRSFWEVFIPIPADTLAFWNHGILPLNIEPYAAAGLFLIVFVLLARKPKYLAWFLMSTLGLALFQHIKYVGYLRHSGHLFIGFVAVIWLLASDKGWQSMYKPTRWLFTIIVLAQLYATVVASVKELTYPFSGSKSTAHFVQQNGYSNYTIIGHPDFAVSAFTAYHAKAVYYPMIRDTGTFVIWSTIRAHGDLPAYLNEQETELRLNADHHLIVSNQELGQFAWLHLIYDSERSIVKDERLLVYKIMP